MSSPTSRSSNSSTESLEWAIQNLTSQLNSARGQLDDIYSQLGDDGFGDEAGYGADDDFDDGNDGPGGFTADYDNGYEDDDRNGSYRMSRYTPVDYDQDRRISEIEDSIRDLARRIRSQQRRLLRILRTLRDNRRVERPTLYGDAQWPAEDDQNEQSSYPDEPYYPEEQYSPEEQYQPDRPNYPEQPGYPQWPQYQAAAHFPEWPQRPHRPDRPFWPQWPDRPNRPDRPNLPENNYPPAVSLSSRNWIAVEDHKSPRRWNNVPFYVTGEVETPVGAGRPVLQMARQQDQSRRVLVLDLVEDKYGGNGRRGTWYCPVRFDQNIGRGGYKRVQINRQGDRIALVDVQEADDGHGFVGTDNGWTDSGWHDKLPKLSDGPDLLRGSSGDRVRTLQQILSTIGYNVRVDGDFGAKTEESVKDFQTSEQLKVDGEVGPITRRELNQVTTAWRPKRKPSSFWSSIFGETHDEDNAHGLVGGGSGSGSWQSRLPKLSDGPDLSRGASGARVRTLQQVLSTIGYAVTIDGDFGAKTEDAVKDFQSTERLKADGVVGSITRRELNDAVRSWRTRRKPSNGWQSVFNDGRNADNNTDYGQGFAGNGNHRHGHQQNIPKLPDGPDLMRGSSGERVTTLQTILSMIGYSIEVDGDYGNKTEEVIKDFQANESLKVDGEVGPITRRELNQVTKSWRPKLRPSKGWRSIFN